MRQKMRSVLSLLLVWGLLLTGCGGGGATSTPGAMSTSGTASTSEAMFTSGAVSTSEAASTSGTAAAPAVGVREDGEYTSRDEVAAYLYVFGHLPDNFITKKEAKALGWDSSKGNLGEVAPGKSIGGDYFGNYEGILPEAEGRKYTECDIDSTGGYRGAKRIVFSNDGLIYYTEDHYETFTLLYGEE